MSSPTRRTLEAYRSMGWYADVCERFIPAGPNRAFGNRKDLFNLFDIITFNPLCNGCTGEDTFYPTVYGIQCFTTSWKEHTDKFLEEHREEAIGWLNAGGGIELWGWRKLKLKRGGKAVRWMPRIQELVLRDNDLHLLEIKFEWSSEN